MLDLGCGSGAIAVSIAHEHDTARLVAADVAPEAVETTRGNAECSGVGERVETVCGNLFAPLRDGDVPERFDLIVSNPPYVRGEEIGTLEPEVREHEPLLALDGGEDGLDFYRRIAAEAEDFLQPEGLLALEVGADQADPVSDLLTDSGRFEIVEVRPDLNGIPRVVVARLLQS